MQPDVELADPETAPAHTAIFAITPANPANERAGEQQEIRSSA
jgi:hypothetical protein